MSIQSLALSDEKLQENAIDSITNKVLAESARHRLAQDPELISNLSSFKMDELDPEFMEYEGKINQDPDILDEVLADFEIEQRSNEVLVELAFASNI